MPNKVFHGPEVSTTADPRAKNARKVLKAINKIKGAGFDTLVVVTQEYGADGSVGVAAALNPAMGAFKAVLVATQEYLAKLRAISYSDLNPNRQDTPSDPSTVH